MKLVKFTKEMRPHAAGSTRVVSDELADKLIQSGEATFEPSVFDSQPRDAKSRQRYLTRKVK